MCVMCAIVFEIHGTALERGGLVWLYIYRLYTVYIYIYLLKVKQEMAHMTHKQAFSEGRSLGLPPPHLAHTPPHCINDQYKLRVCPK